MPRITYVDAASTATTVHVPEGWSLMQGAVANGVDGIVGDCGGAGACATCHCYVDSSRLARLPPAGLLEQELLDSVAAERRPNSRLACQLRCTPALDGLVVTLPDVQA